jgi:hypothetical protein
MGLALAARRTLAEEARTMAYDALDAWLDQLEADTSDAPTRREISERFLHMPHALLSSCLHAGAAAARGPRHHVAEADEQDGQHDGTGRDLFVSGERIGAGRGGDPRGGRPRTGLMLLMRSILPLSSQRRRPNSSSPQEAIASRMRANKRGAFRICSECGVFQAMRDHVIGEDLVEGAVVDHAAKA